MDDFKEKAAVGNCMCLMTKVSAILGSGTLRGQLTESEGGEINIAKGLTSFLVSMGFCHEPETWPLSSS